MENKMYSYGTVANKNFKERNVEKKDAKHTKKQSMREKWTKHVEEYHLS